MELRELIAQLPKKNGAVHTLEGGVARRQTYSDLYTDVAAAQYLLTQWGVKSGARVGIYAPNSYRWLVFDLALIALGAVSVVFTDDFEGKIGADLLDRYGLVLLLLSQNSRKHFPNTPPFIAYIDGINGDVQAAPGHSEVEDDIGDQLSLVFSSGSAGGLKGLVISRKGVCSTLPPIMDALGVTPADSLLLFLPLSNFQQRFLCYAALWYDFDVIITDYLQLFSAMKTLQPSIFLAPPIFYQMVHGEFLKYPGWKRSLWVVWGTLLWLLPSAKLRRGIAKVVFAEFYAQFGSRIRLLITGMAPIRRNISKFFRLMQLPLCEAYGMVEAGVMALRAPGSREIGSVGKPLRGVQFSIEEDNEIIVTRDHPLTLRYFQCANGENEKTFVGPSRISTGDMGRVAADGSLYLLGRKKELIVTAGGLKVHPEALEEEINNHPDVANSVIFQRKDVSHLTCIVSLNRLDDEDARVRVKKAVTGLAPVRKLAPYTEVIFAEAPFSKENGMLRPNMKIDRKRIVNTYGTLSP
jgi:long-chain acyl-CoA synthetase